MAKTQIDFMPILLAGGAYLAYKGGLLDPLLAWFGLPPSGGDRGKPPPDGGDPPVTEDQAALIVAANQSGLCSTMSSMSGGLYNCETDANRILLVRQWFYVTDPGQARKYGNLINYVKAMGWGSVPPPGPQPGPDPQPGPGPQPGPDPQPGPGPQPGPDCSFQEGYRYVAFDETVGQFYVVWNGVLRGHFPSQGAAEQAYNDYCFGRR